MKANGAAILSVKLLGIEYCCFCRQIKVAKTNLKYRMQEDVLIFKPDDDKEFKLSIIGSKRHLTEGLWFPIQNPASTMFSDIIRTCGGKLRIMKLTGQRLTVEDLKSGTPSVELWCNSRLLMHWVHAITAHPDCRLIGHSFSNYRPEHNGTVGISIDVCSHHWTILHLYRHSSIIAHAAMIKTDKSAELPAQY